MEGGNKNPSEPNDIADEQNESEVVGGENTSTATKPEPMVTEDIKEETTGEQAGTSSVRNEIEPVVEKPTKRRNYRRRTENSDDNSSDDADMADQAVADNIEEHQPSQQQQPQQAAQSSDSEDVSLEDLHVSGSDDNNQNQNARR